MHELSVTEQLLNLTLVHARQANAKRVLKINLVLGDLSSFVGESIRFCFDALSKGTEAEKAFISISRKPAIVRCRKCKDEFTPREMNWACPRCGGFIEEVVSGREFYIESIEIE
jgi:hydrogenase nickel incorporation protein HypA/HybF